MYSGASKPISIPHHVPGGTADELQLATPSAFEVSTFPAPCVPSAILIFPCTSSFAKRFCAEPIPTLPFCTMRPLTAAPVLRRRPPALDWAEGLTVSGAYASAFGGEVEGWENAANV